MDAGDAARATGAVQLRQEESLGLVEEELGDESRLFVGALFESLCVVVESGGAEGGGVVSDGIEVPEVEEGGGA